LKVSDPRGFLACIEDHSRHGEGIFDVFIPLFEQCPRPEQKAQPYVPGISKLEGVWFDEYRGTAKALAALGLVQLNQLPGQPGMRKVRVRILSDGSVLFCPPNTNCNETKEPGAKEIERAGAGMFRVRVHVSAELEQQRRERAYVAEREWEQRIQALPRPAPLNEGKQMIEREIAEKAADAKRDNEYQTFKYCKLLPRSGWKGNKALRAEVDALYRSES
jgi:hypothetical protein